MSKYTAIVNVKRPDPVTHVVQDWESLAQAVGWCRMTAIYARYTTGVWSVVHGGRVVASSSIATEAGEAIDLASAEAEQTQVAGDLDAGHGLSAAESEGTPARGQTFGVSNLA